MKLQFTNSYRPRFDQISRILQYLLKEEGRKKIPQQEIVENLGIPKNQVENLISMMVGFGLVRSRVTTLTELGKEIIQADPYFEKIESLWIIHYIVSSNPEWVVWYRIINNVLPSLDKFTVENTSNSYFSDLSALFSEKTIADKLPKEIAVVYFSYAHSEFARLNLLQQEGPASYVRGNPVDVPSQAFLFCILYYRDRHSPGSSAMNVEDICLAEYSPGRVFNMPEYQVRQLLDELHNNGLIRLEKFANLDQVRFSEAITQQFALAKIYGG